MSTAKTLNIINYFGSDVDAGITSNNFNCCDRPKPGDSLGRIGANHGVSFVYQRTDGHGCNGEQGYFQIAFDSDYLVDMNFDSDGDIQIGGTTNNMSAFLLGDADGNYTMIVGHHVV